MITSKIKAFSLLMTPVRVTLSMTHRTVFIIVIEKEKKQFFSFKAISDVLTKGTFFYNLCFQSILIKY